jgi:hypothetical protein
MCKNFRQELISTINVALKTMQITGMEISQYAWNYSNCMEITFKGLFVCPNLNC